MLRRKPMTSAQLEAGWLKRHKNSRKTARNTRWRIYWMIIVSVLSGIAALVLGLIALIRPAILEEYSASELEKSARGASRVPELVGFQIACNIVSIVGSLVALALIVLVIRSVRRYIKVNTELDRDTDRFRPLTGAAVEAVNALLVPLCKRMGMLTVTVDRIVLLSPRRSTLLSPSVVQKRDGTVLMSIPADFLTLIGENPPAAEAMLAHELGHVAQQDASLWLYSSAFADHFVRYFLPLYLANILLFLLLETAFLGRLPMDPSTRVGIYLQGIAITLAPVAGLIGFHRRIRRYRRSSEELADLAAWLFTDPHGVGLQAAFRLAGDQKQPSVGQNEAAFGFFGGSGSEQRGVWGGVSIHPPLKYRQKQASHYSQIVEGKTRRLHLTRYTSFSDAAIVLPLVAGVLALVLYPVFNQAREKARQASCLSNEKQIATAMLMYSQDYDESFPPAPKQGVVETTTWADRLKGYTYTKPVYLNTTNNTYSSPYQCPSAEKQVQFTETTVPTTIPTNYLYNGVVAGRSLAVINAPADTILTHEDSAVHEVAMVAPQIVSSSNTGEKETATANHANAATFDLRHQKGGNLAFADGHLKFRKKAEIQYANFGLSTKEEPPFLETDPTKANDAGKETRTVDLNAPTSSPFF